MSKFDITISGNLTKLNEIKKKFTEELPQKIVSELVDFGKERAKDNVSTLGAIDMGELYESIDGEVSAPQPHYCEGKVKAGTDHCKFVEFGTGIVGKGRPHPEGGWAYDVNGHGVSGWWYYDDVRGKVRWTQGMPSRPYMYNARKQTEEMAKYVIQREADKLK